MEGLNREQRENPQEKQINQNKVEILEPNRKMVISLRKYTLKLNRGRMNFNTDVLEVHYLLPVTG